MAPGSHLTILSDATSYLQNEIVMIDSGNWSEDFSVHSTVVFDGGKHESETMGRQSLENVQIGCSFASEQVREDGQADSLLHQSTSSYFAASKNEFIESRNFLLDSHSNLVDRETDKLLPQKDNFTSTGNESWKGNQNIYIDFVDGMSSPESFLKSVEGVSQALATVVPLEHFDDAKEDTSSVFSQFVVNPTFEDFPVSEESDFSAQSQVTN